MLSCSSSDITFGNTATSCGPKVSVSALDKSIRLARPLLCNLVASPVQAIDLVFAKVASREACISRRVFHRLVLLCLGAPQDAIFLPRVLHLRSTSFTLVLQVVSLRKMYSRECHVHILFSPNCREVIHSNELFIPYTWEGSKPY
mmetsp:Transcript_12531/g.22718  ORF Transcript_12531/g.22718 Transcript_12531/m.22718 type:complete len:145 (+) Transcript_12531:2130-2564(+)